MHYLKVFTPTMTVERKSTILNPSTTVKTVNLMDISTVATDHLETYHTGYTIQESATTTSQMDASSTTVNQFEDVSLTAFQFRTWSTVANEIDTSTLTANQLKASLSPTNQIQASPTVNNQFETSTPSAHWLKASPLVTKHIQASTTVTNEIDISKMTSNNIQASSYVTTEIYISATTLGKAISTSPNQKDASATATNKNDDHSSLGNLPEVSTTNQIGASTHQGLLSTYTTASNSGTSQMNADCPAGFTKFESNCYFIGHALVPYSEARTRCQELTSGGHLANLASKEARESILDLLNEAGCQECVYWLDPKQFDWEEESAWDPKYVLDWIRNVLGFSDPEHKRRSFIDWPRYNSYEDQVFGYICETTYGA